MIRFLMHAAIAACFVPAGWLYVNLVFAGMPGGGLLSCMTDGQVLALVGWAAVSALLGIVGMALDKADHAADR